MIDALGGQVWLSAVDEKGVGSLPIERVESRQTIAGLTDTCYNATRQHLSKERNECLGWAEGKAATDGTKDVRTDGSRYRGTREL